MMQSFGTLRGKEICGNLSDSSLCSDTILSQSTATHGGLGTPLHSSRVTEDIAKPRQKNAKIYFGLRGPE